MIDVGSGEILKAETEKCTGNEQESLINSIKNVVDEITTPASKEEQHVLGRICNKSTAELNVDVDSYTKAIELNPKDAEAYNNRGKTYHGLGEYHKAMEDYGKAIELSPKYAEAYAYRAFAYVNLEEYNKAIDDCNTAIKLNPDYAEAYAYRGFAYFNLGQAQNAMDDFNRSIKLSPEYADAYCGRGAVYCVLGQSEKAIDDLNRAITLDSRLALAYFTRGVAYASLKTYTVSASGDIYQAGILFLKQRDKTRAMKSIDMMKRIDPSSPLVKKLMDKVYEEQ
jgi:tetratricopeptide (TPR) repeat protein